MGANVLLNLLIELRKKEIKCEVYLVIFLAFSHGDW